MLVCLGLFYDITTTELTDHKTKGKGVPKAPLDGKLWGGESSLGDFAPGASGLRGCILVATGARSATVETGEAQRIAGHFYLRQ